MSAPLIRVLVVDDSPFMRGVLPAKIEADPRFKVVGTAVDGRDAIEKTLALSPDVVTLDIDMPNMNGIDALKEIVKQSTASVIMLSARTEQGAAITLEALSLGAVDFIPKSRGVDRIHEKLLAAVEARTQKSRLATARPAAAIRQTAPPRAAGGARVNAKICVIGSSTGGPQALQTVLSQLPDNLPVPVVVAQHMPPNFTKALAQRLNDTCKPKVVEATDGMTLSKGTVYISPGGMQTRVTAGEIKVSPDQGESLYKPSVDVLAESARGAFGKNVLGVMLTGMGADGAMEFAKLRKLGGYNISQDQASCVVYGMPRSLVESGGADEVLPLDQIGMRIRSALGC
ncbi:MULTISPECIES: protein-glutamate methylesterase/protein-glutamine glutaminase [Hyphomicrobium]|jgi:two-component system chemotaxis response regulator CheB|uniref:protein-glutamate methylesterase/protein-glutamine glutaminase n=1 Tax=Hyphomicrobium TaxID=81 RepID=UPI000360E419|nr:MULTISPECIES: chemotaxis response regulator protein-glutamate methylesterase [Hyphomicrobium]WBT38301.1 chemotaxis response regulator protein-glutamate methylesterase [Hyphomicrobium sp. DMF-1]